MPETKYTSKEFQKLQSEDVHLRESPSIGPHGRPKKGETSRWTKENSYTATLVVNKERYLRITHIAYEERKTRKDVIDRLLALGIEAYEKDRSVLEG